MRFFILAMMTLGVSGLTAAQTPPNRPAFERQIFAGQLGEISALALGEDGSIYAADIGRGVIYRFADRGKDGKLDSRQVAASNFERPSGLAVKDGRLFVSDARAIWEVTPRGGDVRHVASLANSQTLTAPRPLRASAQKDSLIIGLTDRDGVSSKLVQVDIETGKAALIASGHGQIDALAGTAVSDLWAASGSAIFPVYGQSYDAREGAIVRAGTRVSGLVLPSSDNKVFAAKIFPDHIFTAVRTKNSSASFSRAEVMRVYALSTQFGKPSGESPTSLAGDIQASRNRGGDRVSGAMVMDERGIFLADSAAGTVWRLVKARPKLRTQRRIEPAGDDKPDARPKTELNPQGSGLRSASTLTEGTTLKVGSTIPEDDDEEDEKENGGPEEEPPFKIIPSSPKFDEDR